MLAGTYKIKLTKEQKAERDATIRAKRVDKEKREAEFRAKVSATAV